MKLSVKKPFKDKDTGKVYSAGDVIEVTKARGQEILSHVLELAEEITESSDDNPLVDDNSPDKPATTKIKKSKTTKSTK